ncbi:MAG: hypothetical protein ACOX0U_02245 [Oscillospiraceae bacterium]
MDKRKMTLFAGMLAVIIVFAIFSSFWSVIFQTGGSISVLWPSPAADASPNSGNMEHITLADGYQRIRIDPENVQAVVRTLARPQQYTQTVRYTLFWGEKEQRTASVFCATLGEYTAAKAEQPGKTQYSIWGKGTLYRWYQGEHNWYQSQISYITADTLQYIPTYEAVLLLKQDQIQLAQYVTLNQKTCIYVEFMEPDSDTRSGYWIDAEQGVLLRAESYDGDRMIWSVEVSAFSTSAVDESLFSLPNGVDVRTLSS